MGISFFSNSSPAGAASRRGSTTRRRSTTHFWGESRLRRRAGVTLAAVGLAATGLIAGVPGANFVPGQPAVAQAAPGNSEAAARAEFEALWDSTDQVTPFSAGTIISSCTPGTAQPEAVQKMLSTWNYLRSLNGLTPVSLPADYAPQGPAQAAALTAAAGPVASPTPDAVPGAACLNEDVKLASRSGVIARLDGIVTPATEILRYITEASATNMNDNLGHRLQMFSPVQANAAIGAVSIGTSGPTATSIQLFDTTYQAAGRPAHPSFWNPTNPQPPSIAWPAAGYFPSRILPTGAGENVSRWSYSGQCADLRAAEVRVTGPAGEIPLQVIRRSEPGADPNLTPWEYGGYDTILFKIPLDQLTIPDFYNVSRYTVSISNIRTAPNCQPVPTSTSYQINLFNSDWPADPNGDADQDGVVNSLDPRPHIPDLHTNRIGGVNRFETSAAIAKASDSRPAVVYLARSDVFADALVGGVLKDGPVLLVPPDTSPVPPVITETLRTLRPTQVIALGGTGAISDARLYELAGGRTALRIGGANRVDTSVMIARRAFSKANSLYIANAYGPGGSVSPDALTGAALGDGPIVLVDSSSPAIATIRQLATDLQVSRVVALGGPAAVSDAVLQGVANGKAATRLGGRDRYETSREIALESARLQPTTHAYLARGDVFADAVSGGHLRNGPILLVPRGCAALDKNTLHTLAKLNAFQVTALGGYAAICNETLQSALQWPDYVNHNVTEF
ncbi:cell wall-binding repeat-containing protein [uncultured Mobiluncus sp.]|uniref:cell wall-binding repeat-containing protein n=1 Tax=uncultured Mobiluncus sp. TaxID=293425 RepID=UPI0025D0E4FE|nr:cell wall-binding repeat-containing protein [uncultured Mobiluncus sp.]